RWPGLEPAVGGEDQCLALLQPSLVDRQRGIGPGAEDRAAAEQYWALGGDVDRRRVTRRGQPQAPTLSFPAQAQQQGGGEIVEAAPLEQHPVELREQLLGPVDLAGEATHRVAQGD